jgi:hypothetical protein
VVGLAFDGHLNLTQNQNRVAGTLTVGNEVNEVSGTIDEFGVLEFDGRDTDESNGCTAYYSDRPHLALSDQNSVLEGPVLISPAAIRRSPGCTTS